MGFLGHCRPGGGIAGHSGRSDSSALSCVGDAGRRQRKSAGRRKGDARYASLGWPRGVSRHRRRGEPRSFASIPMPSIRSMRSTDVKSSIWESLCSYSSGTWRRSSYSKCRNRPQHSTAPLSFEKPFPTRMEFQPDDRQRTIQIHRDTTGRRIPSRPIGALRGPKGFMSMLQSRSHFLTTGYSRPISSRKRLNGERLGHFRRCLGLGLFRLPTVATVPTVHACPESTLTEPALRRKSVRANMRR